MIILTGYLHGISQQLLMQQQQKKFQNDLQNKDNIQDYCSIFSLDGEYSTMVKKKRHTSNDVEK